jgi:hypothetical protein
VGISLAHGESKGGDNDFLALKLREGNKEKMTGASDPVAKREGQGGMTHGAVKGGVRAADRDAVPMEASGDWVNKGAWGVQYMDTCAWPDPGQGSTGRTRCSRG